MARPVPASLVLLTRPAGIEGTAFVISFVLPLKEAACNCSPCATPRARLPTARDLATRFDASTLPLSLLSSSPSVTTETVRDSSDSLNSVSRVSAITRARCFMWRVFLRTAASDTKSLSFDAGSFLVKRDRDFPVDVLMGVRRSEERRGS